MPTCNGCGRAVYDADVNAAGVCVLCAGHATEAAEVPVPAVDVPAAAPRPSGIDIGEDDGTDA